MLHHLFLASFHQVRNQEVGYALFDQHTFIHEPEMKWYFVSDVNFVIGPINQHF